ncbi:response regulator [Aquabacterium sp. J223]|uniref:response regulator n=1 Tax=Aquabacterium sp. J223 TaxID=2898431 RepID=UPI0021ADBBA0|nr:response regulator transcription factor [Aquabacterium sp. J223]UUX95778.1 response regulator transcription factor [Aquabacterium sp. J223]UUX95790.1 response regulator transcription factor [Aquabacterium sp. J223]
MSNLVDWGSKLQRVLMVDDHVMILQAIRSSLLESAPGLEIDMASSFGKALQAVGEKTYELVILDWHLPDGKGVDTVRQLHDSGCTARVVILSGDASTERILLALQAGAAGFIPKTYDMALLAAALGVVIHGGVFLPPEVLGHAGRLPAATDARAIGDPIANPLKQADPQHASAKRGASATEPAAAALVELDARFPSLTGRQLAVFRAAMRGLSNKLIARELGIAESTVKTHLSAVFASLNVSNRTQAVLLASREGFRVA